ncbi:MAG: 3-deoxy-7-phosphoheptulonate synthase [Oligoflexales bacterium]
MEKVVESQNLGFETGLPQSELDCCFGTRKPYRLVSREYQKESSVIRVRGVEFGPGRFVVMAGPCAVESRDQTLRIARAVKEAGAHVLRGGAYKPRSSPYSFRGLGLEGLKILREASLETGLPLITEAIDLECLPSVCEYADIVQIGARNMQNFALLEAAGKLRKPVMIKRAFSATIDEWLAAAEYIMQGGNEQVLLCERGLRSYDPNTRNLLDISAVPVVEELSHLPVVVDPSHSTGKRTLVAPVSKASLAAGARAILVDVHDRPDEALVDGAQALLPSELKDLVESLRKIASAMEVTLK